MEIAKLPQDKLDLSDYRALPKLQAIAAANLRWFGGEPISNNNSIVPYIYGRCAFEDMADALSTAFSQEHRIYIVGWWVESWVKLKLSDDPSKIVRLEHYLRSTKAQIRGMFWNTPFKRKPGDNEQIVTYINRLPNGAAIEDGRLPRADLPSRGPGAHHQKMVVVSGAKGLVAFLGGMDLNDSRVDYGGVQNPLHDVHIRITGPAAATCLSVFAGRWLDHPDSRVLDQSKFSMNPDVVRQDFQKQSQISPPGTIDSVTMPTGHAPKRSFSVTIGKTYADLAKFNRREQYSFAPKGDQSAWRIVKNAIANTKEFIYLEDQYLVSRRARAELLKKVRERQFRFLLILMGSSSFFENSSDPTANEFPYLRSARNEFRTDLSAIDPARKKWGMFSLTASNDPARQQWCGGFVHSKLWICDDQFVAVGSANCDDRGYTYDSELMAGIIEEPFEHAMGTRFARDLRVALWHKHLGLPHSYFVDFTQGLKHWLKSSPNSMVFDASEIEDSPTMGKRLIRDDRTVNYAWTHLIDPDADYL